MITAALAAVVALVLVVSFSGLACALTGSSPPTVSHPVNGSYQDCRSCHEEGSQGAPRTDHAKKPDCTSCHHPVQPAP